MTTFSSDATRDCSLAWEFMPWVLQGNASDEQSGWLMTHLAQCESCRAEFELQSRLQLALNLPSEVPLDAEAGLQRLMQRIDAPEPRAEPATPRPAQWLLRGLVAAVLVQAIGIGVMGSKLWSPRPQSGYRTLSEAAPAAVAGSIRVVPTASMTLADWDALLHRLQLHVVSGPNEVGAYTLAPAHTGASPQDALKRLRASHSIRFAEPVAAP